MCRKNDKSFSDRSSIVFIPSSHARLAVLEMGIVGRGCSPRTRLTGAKSTNEASGKIYGGLPP